MLATQKLETGGSGRRPVGAKLTQDPETLSEQQTKRKRKRTWGMAQIVESLPSN
jgi:hypothetical protein